jgi:phage I-like protein
MSNFKNFFIGRLQLSDGVDRNGIKHVQLLRVGTFKHPKAPSGAFSITEDMLRRMKTNFENNVRRLDKGEIPVDYGHNSEGKAAGWINKISLEENDKSLWVDINYTAEAEQAIVNREWRFISADIDFEYKDNEADVLMGPVLLGAGLVNRPHIKAMQAVFSEENNYEETQKEYSMTPEEMLKKIGELEARVLELESKVSAKGEELAAAEKKMGDVKAEGEAAKKELKEATLKIVTLTEEKEKSSREAKFNEYLNAGKVLPAQKEAFMEMPLTLSEKLFKDVKAVNFNDNGHGGNGGNAGEKTTDKIIEERAAEKMKNDSKLSLSEAYSRVLSEDKELAKKYESSMQA